VRPREKLTFQGYSFAYAGLWRRLQALILDTIILTLVGMALDAVFRGATALPFEAAVVSDAVNTLFFFVYFAAFESSSFQATPGKYWIGLAVFDRDGNRPSFLRALGRTFCKFVSVASFGLGFLMVLWTARKQALHDLMTGCLVMEWLDTPENASAVSR